MGERRDRGLGRYAWWLVVYTIGLTLWTAWIRFDHGAPASTVGGWAFWTHCGLLALGAALFVRLPLWAARSFRPRTRVRRSAALAVGFYGLWIGVYVLERWLAAGTEPGVGLHMVAISLRLAVLLGLLGATILVSWWAAGRLGPQGGLVGRRRWGAVIALMAVFLTAVTGAFAAPGDVLVPLEGLAGVSWTDRLFADLSGGADLRTCFLSYHPLLAAATTLYAATYAARLAGTANYGEPTGPTGRGLLLVLLLQAVAGVAGVLDFTPGWLPMAHLLLAELSWILLVLITVAVWASSDAPQTDAPDGDSPR